MSNGSEHMPEKTKITNKAEQVPVRWGPNGRIVGRATVSDRGEIQIILNNTDFTEKIYQDLLYGLADHLSLTPGYTPAVPKTIDEDRRRLEEFLPTRKKD